jgi:hypothetical protein
MPLAPITVQLSHFEQIEILRHEIEQFEEELKKTESRTRDVLYQVEKQRYLQTIHPVFQHSQAVADSNQLSELYTARETIASALEAMKAALAQLEAIAGPAPAASRQGGRPVPTRMPNAAPPFPGSSNPQIQAPGAPGQVRRNRFDAF